MNTQPLPPLYMALVHHPVVNQLGEVVTTSITTFDIHDGARISRSFGVKTAYYISPIVPQQDLLDYFRRYWFEGHGSVRNPSRSEAMSRVKGSLSLEATIEDITRIESQSPLIIATSARPQSGLPTWTLPAVVGQWKDRKQPLLLLFGTGWGLADNALCHAHAVLPPILGHDHYNHLPVRAAMAIYLHALCDLTRTHS